MTVRRALVTGATGYIGSHLCLKLLAQGWEVHALLRESSRTERLPKQVIAHRINKNFSEAVSEAQPQAVFHLAANITPADSPGISEALVQDNVLYGQQLLEALVATSCRRFINTGSYWEYAADGSYCPNTLYAASKRAFQAILQWYAVRHGFSAATLVLYDVYGPDDWRGKLLTALLDQLNHSRPSPLAMTQGEQQMDMVHVDDVAEAFLQAEAVLPQPGVIPPAWGVATDRRINLRQLVEIIQQNAGRPLAVNWGAKDYPIHQIMQPAQLALVPGWQARYSVEQGLAKLLKKAA
ncbi:MAG TPA: NAD-dependent epimerase/dehydratase family protein [Alphaproteobacteria bacterium]|nr:NAD-dependent epimerase/dehydratase family protein [Alphaproteobacteria bacterium]